MELIKKETKKFILSFDGETDGLYGDVFAIGGVVIDIETGTIIDSIKVKLENLSEVQFKDEWVKANIVPIVVADNSFTECDRETMLSRIMWFIAKWKDVCFCVVDFGCPVESTILADAIKRFYDRKDWLDAGPYPLHELGTMMFMAGIDPDTNRNEMVKSLENDIPAGVQHDPYWDSITTVFIARTIIVAHNLY